MTLAIAPTMLRLMKTFHLSANPTLDVTINVLRAFQNMLDRHRNISHTFKRHHELSGTFLLIAFYCQRKDKDGERDTLGKFLKNQSHHCRRGCCT